MALVVEDGTGLSTATGYISVAYFRDFVEVEDLAASTYNDAHVGYAIQRATRYMDTRFTFNGYRTQSTQRLEWPRSSAYYVDGRQASGVPIEVQEACAFYTFRSLSARLVSDPIYDSTGGKVSRKRTVVGPITKEIDYAASGNPISFKKYPEADQRLSTLTMAGNRLLRA